MNECNSVITKIKNVKVLIGWPIIFPGHCNKSPQITTVTNHHHWVSSQKWRPQVQHQGVVRATLSPEVLEKILLCCFGCWWLSAFLGLWPHHFDLCLVITLLSPYETLSNPLCLSPIRRTHKRIQNKGHFQGL